MERYNDLQLLFSQRTTLNQSLRFSLKLLEMGNLELQEFINAALVENPFLKVQDDIYGENLDDLDCTSFSIGSSSCDTPDHYSHSSNQPSRFSEKDSIISYNIYSDYGGSVLSTRTFKLSRESAESLNGPSSSVMAPVNNKDEFFKHLAFFKFSPERCAISERFYDYLLDHEYLCGEFLKDISKHHNIPYDSLLLIIKKLQAIPPYGMFSFNFQDRVKNIWEILGKYDTKHKTFLKNINLLYEKGLEFFKSRTKLTDMEYSRIIEDVKDMFRYTHSVTNFAKESSLLDVPYSAANIDLSIKIRKAGYEVEFCDTSHPVIRRKFFKDCWDSARSEVDRNYMREKIKSAELLVRAMNYRNSTLTRVCREIANRQIDFFIGDSPFLLPIDAKLVAASMMCHPSTIYRAVNNKIVDTPKGIFLLKELMPCRTLTNKHRQMTVAKNIQNSIRKIIENEANNSPYSDKELSNLLESRGINISRRTIAKYRKNMEVANSNDRSKKKLVVQMNKIN